MNFQLRKLLLTVLVAALLIIAFHKALAESDLSTIPAMLMSPQQPHVATCENLREQYAVFQKRLIDDGIALEAYTLLAATTYQKWHEVLSPSEEKERTWPEKYFTPLELSATRLEKTSSDLYAVGTEYENEVNRVSALVKKCFVDNEARARTLHELEQFLQIMTESQSTSADFLAQMQSRLRDGTKQWKGLETKSARVPRQFFQLLKHDSEVFTEASGLLRENASMVAEKYQPVIDALSSLTPNPPNKLIVRLH